jgi:N-acetylmuramoyl-L-alanine amidase
MPPPVAAVPSQPTSQSQKKSEVIIVLDPGHGGKDLGAEGVGGILEKDIVLAVAKEMRSVLQNTYKMRVYLTREDDRFVPLRERTEFANEIGATMFVSLHANATKRGSASGIEVYYLDNTGDKASRRLAEEENKSLLLEEEQSDLSFILSDLIQNAKLEDSITLANRFERETMRYVRSKYPGVSSLGVKKAPFYVLVGAHMPCILMELFFVDNKGDAKLLANPTFRRDLAVGLSQAVSRYVQEDLRLTLERRTDVVTGLKG